MSRIYFVFSLLIGFTLLMSWSANPPDGKTGAPGDGLCTDCHSLNGGTQDGSITVTGFPVTIQPATAYILTITNSNPNGVASKGGFQMTVLNSMNQKAGTMTSPSVNSVVTPSAGREYWEHNPAQDYPGNNMITWTVTWTSPNGPPNDAITFYAAGNVANGNGNNSGDLIVTSNGTGTMDGGIDPLIVDIEASQDVSCEGGSDGSALAGASGGVPPYSYVWSNGAMGAMLTGVPFGTYTVTATDNQSSTATTSVMIDEPTAVSFNTPVINDVSCFGGNDGSITASATGGVGGYQYNWSNGAMGATITGLVPGSYTVTVTDASNCTGLATYDVNEPAQLEINLESLQHETCFGAEDGAIMISVSGGVVPVFAEWSNGFIGTTISDLAPDNYTVTVTDNNNCTAMASYTINPGGVVNVTLENIQHVTCNGGADGSISVSANGGQAPYTFEWSNGATGPDINMLAAGSYLVTATDNNGCEVVKVYTITQPAPISITINADGANLCAGDSLVNLTAVAAGDHEPFTGEWSNGVSGLTNNNLSAGSYTITVTDAAGCTASASTIVTAPSPVIVSVLTTDETAAGANDGTAIAVASGGTPDYTYLWSNGSTTDSIGGLPPGVYTVTVTDNNGCTATASGQVDAFGCTFDVDLGPDTIICEGESLMINGSPGAVTYAWSTGEGTESILVSTGGEYCLTATDGAGCQDVDCIVISIDTFPLITCPVTDESVPGANDGAIACDSISGSITYLWSTGATTPSIVGLAPGDYCVTMTNNIGCSAEQCFTVHSGSCQLVVTSIVEPVLCAGDSTGSVSVSVENATPPVSYFWSTGDTTASVNNLPAGNYAVTIADGAGCAEVYNVVIPEPAALLITIDTIIDINVIEGSIAVTVTGGVAPYTYLWIFPDGSNATTEDLALLTMPGLYTLEVVDANGCGSSSLAMVQMGVAVNPGPEFKPLRVYPVPTQDILHVELDAPVTEALIMGIDGRLQKRIVNPASNNLEVGELEPGWYVIRITDGQSWYIARMIK